MKKTRIKNLFLIFGIVISLIGSLMSISHINYGIETLIVGVLILWFIIPVFTNSLDDQTTNTSMSNYPNILQSFGITGIVILGMLLFSPVKLVLNNSIGNEASMLIYYLLAIGVPFWIVYSIRKSKTNYHSFNLAIKNKRIIPLVIIGMIALFFGVIIPIGDLIPMPESVKKAFMDFTSQTGIFTFLLLVISAPILEELIFRGIILDGLLRVYSPIKSILISSFLFGLVHLNPWQFVTGLIIGIFSGWIYYRTQSLSFPIIIHAAANLTGFLMRYFIDRDLSTNNTLLEMCGGVINLILAIVGPLLIVTICIYYLRKEFERGKIEITEPGTLQ